MAWTADMSLIWGEYQPIRQGWICVQPPATPAVASLFVSAADILDEPRYLDIAREARDALIAIQTAEGGFPYQADPSRDTRLVNTLDDGVTTGAIHFLLDLYEANGGEAERRAAARSGDFLLAEQYPCGGWPQRVPAGEAYQRNITLNDGVMANAITVLLRLHHVLGGPRYKAAALQAGECLLMLQGGEGEAIWAQQYDPDTLAPAPARRFEPAGYTPNESLGVLQSLLTLFAVTRDARYLDAVERALDWYDARQPPGGMYARLYEPGTGRPIYGLAEGGKTYDRAEARCCYAWEGPWYPEGVREQARRLRETEDARWQDRVSKPAWLLYLGDVAPDMNRAQEILAGLAADGHWYDAPHEREQMHMAERDMDASKVQVVETRTFVAHAGLLLRCIEANPQQPERTNEESR